MATLLDVRRLGISFPGPTGPVRAVDDVTWRLEAGRTLGIVGESGSGKSLTGLALLRLLPAAAEVDDASRVLYRGQDLLALPEDRMRALRGGALAIVFQEPMACLHPLLPVGRQVGEAVRRHAARRDSKIQAQVDGLFAEVGLPEPDRIGRRYPHELSGGQQQRVMIAMALAGNPEVLVADEPTTALDVTVQAQILTLLRELQERRGLAMVFISHDLAVVSSMAHDVMVMRQGRMVEAGPMQQVLTRPRSQYAQMLIAARRRLHETSSDCQTCDAAPEPVLHLDGLTVDYAGRGFRTAKVRAVDAVSLTIARGTTLGLVGESGSGKSTIGKAVVGLVRPSGGDIRLLGRSLAADRWRPPRAFRRHCQIVLQNPYGSLNPRLTVADALMEPFVTLALRPPEGIRARMVMGLEEVGLDAEMLSRYPHQLSGGQRQRVCIARALTPEPTLLICDEIVSALDVHVQFQVLDLLKRLQKSRRLSLLFIGHDLEVIRFIADDIAVMHRGRIVERAGTRQVLEEPQHPYSRSLISAIPRLATA